MPIGLPTAAPPWDQLRALGAVNVEMEVTVETNRLGLRKRGTTPMREVAVTFPGDVVMRWKGAAKTPQEQVVAQIASVYKRRRVAAPAVPTAAAHDVPPPPRETVTRTGKALGFRSWKLEGYNLFSANEHFGGWKVGSPTEATCKGGRHSILARYAAHRGMPLPPIEETEAETHAAPDPACHCGLYALHAPEFMSRWHQGEPLMVHGAVLGWGRLEVHHEGWRAQYAQPVMLAFDGDRQPYNHCERVKALGEELCLPVVEWPAFEARARALADPVPRALRPDGPERTPDDPLGVHFGSPHWGGGAIGPVATSIPYWPSASALGMPSSAFALAHKFLCEHCGHYAQLGFMPPCPQCGA